MKKIILILSLMLIFSGCLWWGESFQAKINTPNDISISDWKNYDSEFGYKTIYPPNLLLEKRNSDEIGNLDYITLTDFSANRKVDFKVFKGSFEQNIISFMSEMEYLKKEQITVDGKVGVKIYADNKITVILPLKENTLKIVLADLTLEDKFNKMVEGLEIK